MTHKNIKKSLDPDPDSMNLGSNSTTLVGGKPDLKYSDAGRDDNCLLAGALQAAVDEVLLEGVQRDVQGLEEVALNPVSDPGFYPFRIPDPGSRISDPGSKNSNKREG